MSLARLPDWPQRLDAAIEAARGLPFGYGPGESHCCLFVGDCALAMTGRDPIAWFRGRYRDERGAYVALRRFGGGDIPEAMARISQDFPAPEIPVALAGRGDVVLHDTPDGPALGVCVGSRFAAVTRPRGLEFLSMSAALRAWRV